MLNTGVVDQNIDRAKGRLGMADHGLDLGGFAHVGTVVAHRNAECGNFCFGAFDVAKAIHHDVGALGGQCFGQP